MEALGRYCARATPERPGTTGTACPRYGRMRRPALAGIIKVVPWKFSALDAGQGRFLIEGRNVVVKQYVVDAFADQVFGGNPAAVVVTDSPLEEGLMTAVTRENNLSETAFAFPEGESWRLRWFTPVQEIDLCGHATLAAAFVIDRFVRPGGDSIRFQTLSGAGGYAGDHRSPGRTAQGGLAGQRPAVCFRSGGGCFEDGARYGAVKRPQGGFDAGDRSRRRGV